MAIIKKFSMDTVSGVLSAVVLYQDNKESTLATVLNANDTGIEQAFTEAAIALASWQADNLYFYGGQFNILPAKEYSHQIWDWTLNAWIDPRTLVEVKEARWSGIKQAREAVLTGPLPTPYGIFDATVEAQKSITDAVLMLQTLAAIGSPQTIDFTLADNTTINLTTEQMVTVGLMLGARTQATYSISRARRIQIEAATTIAEVEAITWDMP